MPTIHDFLATTDLWTSVTTYPSLSFTVHFVNGSWEFQSFCLEAVPLYEEHTGENITDSILDVMNNWDLSPEKLDCDYH